MPTLRLCIESSQFFSSHFDSPNTTNIEFTATTLWNTYLQPTTLLTYTQLNDRTHQSEPFLTEFSLTSYIQHQ
jgi:hypothetical protein